MTTPITPASSWDAIVGPADLEAGAAASVNNGFQALANRIQFLRDDVLIGRALVQLIATVSAGDGETNSVLRSFTTTGYVKTTELDIVHNDLKTLDTALVLYHLNMDKTGTTDAAYLKATATRSGGAEVDVPGAFARFAATTAYQGRTIFGVYQIPTDGNYTFDLQGRVVNGADALRINSTAIAHVLILRSPDIPA